jgi:class 3 adenylate cyclase
MDIGGWLQSVGLGQYERAFVKNAIGSDVLPDLTEADLEKLEIPLGDRKRLIRAIRTMVADLHGTTIANDIGEDTHNGQPLIAIAERRHLTVMICDLVGSTALSARLDPEDMNAVMDAFQAACTRIIKSYDGFPGDFRGDGILAYFGYPRAHEDDAERTVRAALDIIAEIVRLETPAAEPLAVRIGIATGLVVVGDLSGESVLREHAVVGDTPNLAARLQALADPGTIVVAASTRRLLGDLFGLRDLGSHEMKGFAEPVEAWAVEGVSDAESRFDPGRAIKLTDLVGRKAEIEFLLERQRLAWKGEGQIVLISGEPGIGKSRLAAALAQHVATEPHQRLRYQCSLHYTNSALHPLIAQLERVAGFKADDTAEQRLDKLEAVLPADQSRIRTIAPLLAALLSIPFGKRYPPLVLSPAQQRRRTFAALLDLFEERAKRPTLLLFEDLQWADATSLELLDLAVERLRQLPVLALYTFRPDFEPPWAGLPNVSTLALGRLEHEHVERMVERVTGGRTLPAEVMKQIVAKTDGNPLFVEELTKAVLEAGILVEGAGIYRLDGPLPPLAIPATLQDSLMARLDRLASVKAIAQIGSVIGREFSYSLIKTLVRRDEPALDPALAELERAELVSRRSEPPDAVYTFKHALVRDVAYESLLKSRRHQLHGLIARTLTERFPDIAASQPEIVAHHFTESGLFAPAIEYWLKAGQQATRRSANAEALHHLARGLELLPALDDLALRNKLELPLQTLLGNALRATKGWSIDGVKHAYTRALQLCKESGFDEQTLPAVFGLFTWNFVRAALGEAQILAEYLLSSAENVGDPSYKVLANQAQGFTFFALGKFGAARAALERGIDMCEDRNAAKYLDLTAQDPRIHMRLYNAMVLWLLGHPDRAFRLCAEACQ